MAGQLKIGGNVIATHAGTEGAGTVTLDSSTLTIGSNTTIQGAMNAGSIASGVTFPAGHVIQTNFIKGDSTDVIINNTTNIGDIELEFNRKVGNSYFLITITAMIYRPSTSAAAFLGYRISVGGSTVATVERMVTDDNSWGTSTCLFKNTTTGSANDTVKVESYYKNSAGVDNNFRDPTLLVQEIAV